LGRKRIRGAFAHPDAETSDTGGTFTRTIRKGVDIHGITATQGELGTLGTGGVTYTREAELRAVPQLHRASAESEPRLIYVALSKEVANEFELDIDGPETKPTHHLDLNAEWTTKVAALRLYRSQEDTQELAEIFQ